jgi:hypothetical protein
MSLNPLEALASLTLGLIKQGKVQAWCRIAASMLMSALVTGIGTWGLAILAGSSFLTACAISAVSVSSVLITAWTANPECRRIPLFWPGRLERERQKMLQEENVVSRQG